MKNLKNFLGCLTTATLCLTAIAANPANAGTLKNGWNYAVDSSSDSTGGAVFEMYGLAIKVNGNEIWVAINANLPLGGTTLHGSNNAEGGEVAWGDLFFDFNVIGSKFTKTDTNISVASGQSGFGNFNAANSSGSLFAIRFDANTDQQTPAGPQLGVGVYSNVTAKSISAGNNSNGGNLGWDSLDHHPNDGKNAFMGDLGNSGQTRYSSYFSPTGAATPNAIASGTKVGDISFLNSTQLGAAGFDTSFTGYNGSETFGFKFDRGLLPAKDYIATAFMECINDGTSLVGTAVPEPMTIAGTILAAAFGTALKRRQQKKKSSVA